MRRPTYYITPIGVGWGVYIQTHSRFVPAGLILGDRYSSGALATLAWLGTNTRP